MPVVARYHTGAALTLLPDPAQSPSAEAEAMAAAFGDAVGRENQATLQAGRPYAVADRGRVVWVHPDGSRRLTADPSSPRA
jgi:hypothetical protein